MAKLPKAASGADAYDYSKSLKDISGQIDNKLNGLITNFGQLIEIAAKFEQDATGNNDIWELEDAKFAYEEYLRLKNKMLAHVSEFHDFTTKITQIEQLIQARDNPPQE